MLPRIRTASVPLLAALGVLALSGPALAGDAYSFSTERRGGLAEGTRKSRIIIDGSKYRVEHEPDEDSPLPSHAIVSKDGGEHEFALNLEQRTFYELEEAAPDAPTSLLFSLLPAQLPGKRSVANVRLEKSESPEPETIAGMAARKHEITLSYDISVEIPPPPNLPFKGATEKVRGKVTVNAVYWMAEDRSPLPFGFGQPRIHTGFPEIDGKLEGALATLRGLAVKEQVSIVSEGDQGVAPRSETSIKVIESVRSAKTQPAMFEVPSGFRRHKPELIAPGLTSSSGFGQD